MENKQSRSEKLKSGLKRVEQVIRAIGATGTNILLLSFAVFFIVMAMEIYLPFIAQYMESLGIPDLERGIFFSLIAAAAACVLIPAGLLSDKIQRKWLIIVSGLGLALVEYFFTRAQLTWQFYLLGILQGAFNGLIPPAAYALLMEQATEKTRGTTMSVYLTITSVGAIFAPTLGGIVSTATGTLATGFMWAAVFSVAGAAVALLIRRSGAGFKVSKIALPKRQLLTDSRFVSIMVAFGLLAVANGLLTVVLPIFALDELKMGDAFYGIFITIFLLVITVTQAVAGTFSDKFGKIRSVLVALSAYGAGLILAAFATNGWMLFVFCLPTAVGASAYTPIFYSLIGDIIPSERRGLASGVLNFFYSAGLIGGPLFGGILQGIYGNRPVFPIASFFVLATVAFVMLSFRRHRLVARGGQE
jgi:DHA1 family multidrug resistance protein-like MFS transporter